MDGSQFDQFAQVVGSGASRRKMLGALAGLGLGGLLAVEDAGAEKPKDRLQHRTRQHRRKRRNEQRRDQQQAGNGGGGGLGGDKDDCGGCLKGQTCCGFGPEATCCGAGQYCCGLGPEATCCDTPCCIDPRTSQQQCCDGRGGCCCGGGPAGGLSCFCCQG